MNIDLHVERDDEPHPAGRLSSDRVVTIARAVPREQIELAGTGGQLSSLVRDFVEAALDEEFATHLGYTKNSRTVGAGSNSRNGKRSKVVLTDIAGAVTIAVPRDRDGSFLPVLLEKRQVRLSQVDLFVLLSHARKLNPQQIVDWISAAYALRVPTETTTRIAERLTKSIRSLWSRPLPEAGYSGITFDATRIARSRSQGRDYLACSASGIKADAESELLGVWCQGGEAQLPNLVLDCCSQLVQRGVVSPDFVVGSGLAERPELFRSVWPSARPLLNSTDLVAGDY